ncbi:MAG: agmatine deiminase family protein, partial [Proteobacteria bacterium]|nr:agmatine deiminase family protein [Pseudomonadota bacterium]
KNGQSLQVIELPLPEERLYLTDGTRLPPTYANFYIANGAVLVPIYGDRNDQVALDVLRRSFPQHQVIGLNSRYIINGGGSFHCMTQQQPRISNLKEG